MSITDEQAKIIGREIGREIAKQISSSWYEFTNPSCRVSLSDKISNSIKGGFDLLAMEIRRGQDMEARRRRTDLQDKNG